MSCRTDYVEQVVTDTKTAKEIGRVEFIEYQQIYTDATQTYLELESWYEVVYAWGAVAGTHIKGTAGCRGTCTLYAPESPGLPQQTLDSLGDRAYGAWTFDYRSAVDSAGTIELNGGVVFTYTVHSPSATDTPVPLTGWTPKIRCDNLLTPAIRAGCVFPSYTPYYRPRTDSQWPEYVRHIYEAQFLAMIPGNPRGVYSHSGTLQPAKPLHRTTSQEDRDANGNAACPQEANGGPVRPPGMQCDEYPFRSTMEGASTGAADGWSFSWRMIPATQNNAGGQELRVFYNSNRVINADAFWVEPLVIN